MLFERRGEASLGGTKAGSVSEMLQQLLAARGIFGKDAITAFLTPTEAQLHDPYLFKDMAAAAARIEATVACGEKICVYGDYDVDGIVATALLTDALCAHGARVTYYIPQRSDEGYGLNSAAIEKLRDDGVKLMITVDNGISAVDEIVFAQSYGIDVVVTDHHLPGDRLPTCIALIANKRPDNTYPNADLCGAGIALKLAEALYGREAVRQYLPWVGLATVADVVPLLGENRALVALSLKAINSGEICAGLQALCDAASPAGRAVSERDLAFGLAPRLNASGRLKTAEMGVRLFLTRDMGEARRIAAALSELNASRQEIETAIVEEASRMVEADDITDVRMIARSSKDWHPGVLGIAASRIAERYYRPVFLFSEADGMLTGSARSIPGVDIHAALLSNQSLLLRFGGHSKAAGATLRKEDFAAFADGMNAYMRDNLDEEIFVPRAYYEVDAELSQMSIPLVEEMAALAPFGEGNPEPVFCTRGVKLYSLRAIGEGGAHLKANAAKGDLFVESLFFGRGAMFERILDLDRCDILYSPMADRWNDRARLQLKIKEIEASGIDDAKKYIAEREDKFFDAFLRNLIYNSTRDISGIQFVDAKEALALLCERRAGALVLCFTPEGARELLASPVALPQLSFFKNVPSPCAENAVVLAPVVEELDISRFREILVFDTCMTGGLARALLEKAPNARVTEGTAPQKTAALVEPFLLSRADFKRAYVALANCCGSAMPEREACALLQRQTGWALYQCRFVLRVFRELGFIAMAADGRVCLDKTAPRNELMNSQAYAAVASLTGMMEQYERNKDLGRRAP